MRDKLDPHIERKYHFHAFEVWRDLGYGRTFRATARLISSSPQSVCKWARIYKWKERLTEYSAVVKAKQEAGAIIKIDDPIARKIVDVMDRMEAIIESAFTIDVTGKLSPKIKVESLEDLSKFVGEYRKFLETYHRFVAEHMPKGKEEKRGTVIEKFNVNMSNLSQEDSINLLKEIVHGNDSGGNKPTPGNVSDADYTEVPE